MPKEKYSFVAEIFEHSQRIGRRYDLYEKAHFQTRVRSIDWDEDSKRWHISTNRDDDIKARFVVMALGTATRAKLPGHSRHRRVRGPQLPHQPLGLRLHGRRHERRDDQARRQAGRDHRHRRDGHPVRAHGRPSTPSTSTSSSARRRRSTGAATSRPIRTGGRRCEPGWQRERRENFDALASGQPVEVDLVRRRLDRHLPQRRHRRRRGPTSRRRREERAQILELADFRKMNQIRQRVTSTVTDADTAEALKPYYRQMCKRPTFNDEFLPCFNQDNVTLVDVSEAKGVERITPTGVVANGERVRRRLHHLRVGLRDLARVPAPPRHRDQRPRRVVAVRLLGRRAPHPARLLDPRLPELVLHRRVAERLQREHDRHVRRPGPAHRLRHRRDASGAAPPPSSRPRRPRTSGWTCSTASTSAASASSRRARPATTTTRARRAAAARSSAPTRRASTPSTGCSRNGATQGDMAGMELDRPD